MRKTKEVKKDEKGITLIVLVITIIVLLILASVSIAMLTSNNGILTQSKLAKTTTENKTAEEKVQLAAVGAMANNKLELTVDELEKELKNYKGTVEGNTFPIVAIVDGKKFKVDSEGKVEPIEKEENIQPGQFVNKTQKDNYKDSENNTATIPGGFTVSKISEEQKVSTGLVIYDIPKDEIENVDWTTKNEDGAYNVQTLYNQFVWIPVATEADYQRNLKYPCFSNDLYGYLETTPENIISTDNGYLPSVLQPTADDEKSYETAERNAVLKYNGFYIARYEAGNENGIVVSKQNADIYAYRTEEVYKSLGKTMYDKENLYVKSAMCSGIQWDIAMNFIDKKIDGTGEKIFDVRQSDISRHKGIEADVEKSGKNINDKVQNIYDLEGNCWEYVVEKNNNSNIFNYIHRRWRI